MKMMSQKRMEKMKTELNLTDDQVAKIKEHKENTMEQAKAIRKIHHLARNKKKNK